MLKSVIVCVSLIFLLPGILAAQDSLEYLELEIKFLESNPDISQDQTLVVCDTFYLVKGQLYETFCGNLSLDLIFKGWQESKINLEITQISLPPQSDVKVYDIRTDIDTPLIHDEVMTRGNSVYRVFYTPVRTGKMENLCDYNHHEEDVFYADPSSFYEIYFVPNSLGDYHWNNIRDFLEREVNDFTKLFNMMQPGKIQYYLYPCFSPYVNYFQDTRFGINPSKNLIYQEYSHSTDYICSNAANLTKLYRYWGYAPRILTAGSSNLASFFQFYCKKYKKEENLYELKDMLISHDFDMLGNLHKKRTQSASLVSYLLNKIGLDKFREMYLAATDLTLEDQLENYTGLSLGELEKDWLLYVDTLTFDPGMFNYYAERALAQMNSVQAIELFEEALGKSDKDSLYLSQLFNVYYIVGDYKKSADCIYRLSQDSLESKYYLPLANMHLSAGEVDSAQQLYELSHEYDPDNEIVPYKLGQIEFHRGDYEKALEYFQWVIDSGQSIPIQVDCLIQTGRINLIEDNPETADSVFTTALNASKTLIANGQGNPLYYMRAGEATMYLGEYTTAREYLSLAEFVEMRPFYLGRIFLIMGKTFDLENNREKAREYYQRVIEIPSAFLDKSEAEKYLTAPFTKKN